jgi:hypothetical protein
MSIRIAKALCEILYYLFWEEENEEKLELSSLHSQLIGMME